MTPRGSLESSARSITRAARWPNLPDSMMLGDLGVGFQPSIKREQLDSMHTLGFPGRQEKVVLLGPPTGPMVYPPQLRVFSR